MHCASSTIQEGSLFHKPGDREGAKRLFMIYTLNNNNNFIIISTFNIILYYSSSRQVLFWDNSCLRDRLSRECNKYSFTFYTWEKSESECEMTFA